jgi:cation diffusion facilitator CzcD-associated flavoprotein CzcO
MEDQYAAVGREEAHGAEGPSEPQPFADHHQVVIVGAGFGGIGVALRLRQEGVDDIVILEQEDDLGGTWYVNTYPGCQCDVPSLLYSLSWAPNPDWTRTFATQPEIEEYLRSIGERTGVRRIIRFGTEVTEARWDGEMIRWIVETPAGTVTADVLVLATGPLSTPSLPDIDGLDTFEGSVFHSARWDHDHDLAGKRVAVIGTGASAIQFVPQIQPVVGHLTVFQRTPPWIVPRPDRPFKRWERWMFRHSSLAMRLSRARVYWSRELMVFMFAKRPRLAKYATAPALRHLDDQVPDPALRAKLTPDYTLGCKRVLLSNDYLPTLSRPDVELVTEPIDRVLPHAIVTRDGAEHPVDTIILGTGFESAEYPIATKVRSSDGRTMSEQWSGSARAYLGTSVAGFPNLFLITGPNTGLGHSSMVFMMESQCNYIVDALKTMASGEYRTIDVTPEAMAEFNEEMQSRLGRSVWSSGCSSWYLDASGHNTTMWPDFTWRYRQRTRHFDAGRYALTRSNGMGIPTH